MVMVRYEDVDALCPGQSDLRLAARPAVRGHDQGPALGDGSLDGPERKAVPVAQPFGYVRRRVQPEIPKGQHQDGEAAQPVRVEVAIDENAFSPRPSLVHSPKRGGCVRQQCRVVQPFLGRGQEAGEIRGGRDSPGRQEDHQPPRNAALFGEIHAAALYGHGSGQAPFEQWLNHAAQDATGRLSPTYSPLIASPLDDARGKRKGRRLEPPAFGSRFQRRPRAAARRAARRLSSQSCQTTSSGLALKIDEYVPEMMPINRARTK